MRAAVATAAAIAICALLGATIASAYFSVKKTSPQPISVAVTNAVKVIDPGPYVRRTITVTAVASATYGVQKVEFSARSVGSSTWTPFGTDTTSPYTASYNTATAPDGDYEIRAVMTANGGATAVSAVVTVTSDNTAPRGVDVQAATKFGGTAGVPGAGDRLLFTWSEEIDPATLLAGWDASPGAAVYARFVDGLNMGTGSSQDWVQFFRNPDGTGATGFGQVNLGSNFVNAGAPVIFDSTMATNGAGTTVTVTLGSPSGGSLRTDTVARQMQWDPSSSATDLAGNGTATTRVAESGVLDRDF